MGRYNEKVKADTYARRERVRTQFKAYKSTLSCVSCGFSHPAALDFHHREGKVENIGKMVAKGYSFASILKEIEKCDVLCANCHRILHAEQTLVGL